MFPEPLKTLVINMLVDPSRHLYSLGGRDHTTSHDESINKERRSKWPIETRRGRFCVGTTETLLLILWQSGTEMYWKRWPCRLETQAKTLIHGTVWMTAEAIIRTQAVTNDRAERSVTMIQDRAHTWRFKSEEQFQPALKVIEKSWENFSFARKLVLLRRKKKVYCKLYTLNFKNVLYWLSTV